MMRHVFRYFVALALIAAPAALDGQQGSPEPRRSEEQDGARRDDGKKGHHGRSPVGMLLKDRTEIGLTAEQVARLKAIDARLEEQNRPHVRRLVEIRRALPDELKGSPERMSPERRAAFHERMKAARPLFERINENNRAAMREVGDVLTQDQKTLLREKLRRKWGTGSDGRRRSDEDRDRAR